MKRRLGSDRKDFSGILLLLTALLFFAGIFLGQVCAEHIRSDTVLQLRKYLHGYLKVEEQSVRTIGAFFNALWIYFRYPLAAFFLSFFAVGAAVFPCMTVLYGLCLSFSVCCFSAAFSRDGIILAAAIFGLRCLITLPCYFLLGVPGWTRSFRRAASLLGQGRRTAPIACGRDTWMMFGFCIAVLAVGVLLDSFLAPDLLRLTLKRILEIPGGGL